MMRPAFASTWSAAGFAILLLVILLLPLLLKKSWLPPRSEVYGAVPWSSGAYPYIQKQIFHETSDLDVVFIGSSQILFGVDTPFVQKALSEKLGRDAKVVTLGWLFSGYDATYFIAKDLLERRHVRLLVVSDEQLWLHTPHPAASQWFRWSEDSGALTGLSPAARAKLYTSAVIGAPHNLISLVRPGLPMDDKPDARYFFETNYNAPNPETRLGSVSSRMGYEGKPFESFNFSDSSPEVFLYSKSTNSFFQQTGTFPPAYQAHFARLLALLAQEHGTKIAFLHTPEPSERRSSTINEHAIWPEVLPPPVDLTGIPPATLYKGLTDDEIYRQFADNLHLNQDGQRYFTRQILPSIFKLYDAASPN